MANVLVIGGSGFVGRHIVDAFRQVSNIDLTVSSHRPTKDGGLKLDFSDFVFPDRSFDLIVNAAGYGVVKTETDPVRMMAVNYQGPADYIDCLTPSCHWIQIGTAFEYDLRVSAITESTPCYPRTPYGISKWMLAHYLGGSVNAPNSTVIRPFAMYGPREEPTKIVPYLIQSQLRGHSVPLSAGLQRRDYVYVRDVAVWVVNLSLRRLRGDILPSVINVGSGQSRSLRDVGDEIVASLPKFDPKLWRWGDLPTRPNESDEFYNGSTLAEEWGFVESPRPISFKETVNYYVEHD
ncbi:SDR family oxidoreductase [bacterium]|nr:SDR family oxidoreductase [bacterium]